MPITKTRLSLDATSTSGRVHYRGSSSGVFGSGRPFSIRRDKPQIENEIFAAADAAYEALQLDPVKWREETEERELWTGTLSDGLEP